jgi:hypothetical protein
MVAAHQKRDVYKLGIFQGFDVEVFGFVETCICSGIQTPQLFFVFYFSIEKLFFILKTYSKRGRGVTEGIGFCIRGG